MFLSLTCLGLELSSYELLFELNLSSLIFTIFTSLLTKVNHAKSFKVGSLII